MNKTFPGTKSEPCASNEYARLSEFAADKITSGFHLHFGYEKFSGGSVLPPTSFRNKEQTPKSFSETETPNMKCFELGLQRDVRAACKFE